MKLQWIKFNKLDVEKLPKDKGGIYLYVSPFFVNGFETIEYVGKTAEFYRRHHYEHLGSDEQNVELKNFLKSNQPWSIYIAEVDERFFDRVEYYIYKEYLPPLNKISPASDECIECNLPYDIIA